MNAIKSSLYTIAALGIATCGTLAAKTPSTLDRVYLAESECSEAGEAARERQGVDRSSTKTTPTLQTCLDIQDDCNTQLHSNRHLREEFAKKIAIQCNKLNSETAIELCFETNIGLVTAITPLTAETYISCRNRVKACYNTVPSK